MTLLASGGTRTALQAAGLQVIEVADYTGQPEILGGRVKTLHPKIHGGILARRNLPEDLDTLTMAGIELIDLVIVNLYPFEQTVANPAASFEDAIENIDIGGPSLIRAAAKNHAHVAVVTSPSQYDLLLKEIGTHGGTTSDFRRKLALAAFNQTARYDAAIGAYLEQQIAADREAMRLSAGPGNAVLPRAQLAIRGESSPIRGFLYRARSTRPQSLYRLGTSWEGTLLQQYAGSGQRFASDPAIRGAGGVHPQA